MESSTTSPPPPPPHKPKLTTVRSGLNDLPEHLLIDIITYLPTIDAIQTSFISRRWQNLWSSIPSLSFSYDHFPPSDDSPDDTRRRFANYVNRTLILRHPKSPPLTTFRLQFDFKEYKYTSLIESWIHYAVTHQVAELDVDFYIDQRFHANPEYDEEEDEQEPCFEFQFYVLRNSQVRALKLTRCYLAPPTLMTSVKLASIRSVFLDQVQMTDRMVTELMAGCPNIESLSLEYCWGMENVKIVGLNVKELELKYFSPHEDEGLTTSLEIDCPNLRFLDIDGFEVEKYTLKNSSAMVEASVYFRYAAEFYGYWSKVLSLLGNVRMLTLQNWGLKLLVEQKESFFGSFKFHNLIWLELQTQYSKSDLLGIAVLLELSPNLDTLILDDLYKIDEDESISVELSVKPINLSLPRLREAKMKCFYGTENEYLFIELLKQGVLCQKIVVIYIKDGAACPPIAWVRNPNGAEVQGSSPQWVRVLCD